MFDLWVLLKNLCGVVAVNFLWWWPFSFPFSSGGLKEFCRDYQNLCENAPVNHCDVADFPPSPTTCGSCPGRPQGTPVTAILPYLYLGNEEGAADEALIDRLSIKYILNLTPRCPNFFSHRSDLNYRQIKVNDSNQEDIAQHFDEAIQFIGKLLGKKFFWKPPGGSASNTPTGDPMWRA